MGDVVEERSRSQEQEAKLSWGSHSAKSGVMQSGVGQQHVAVRVSGPRATPANSLKEAVTGRCAHRRSLGGALPDSSAAHSYQQQHPASPPYGLNACVPAQAPMLNPNAQYDGIRKWGLWEVMR